MTDYRGYKTEGLVHESTNTLIRRAVRTSDGKPVILKFLRDMSATPERLARFKREYEITASLNPGNGSSVEGVVRAHAIESQNNEHFLVLEDFGAISLDLIGDQSAWTVSNFLKLAIQVTDALGEVHQRTIIHKDVNPSNIIFNPSTQQAKLIDFGLSTQLPRETISRINPTSMTR